MKRRTISVVITGLLCAAPVPGDIGACGQTIALLSAEVFFASKKRVDCTRCSECGIDSSLCRDACSDGPPEREEFPENCAPLVHDGEVCLRALLAASCGDYEPYVDDADPQVPSECNFCPQ